jgi:hypothetical protein
LRRSVVFKTCENTSNQQKGDYLTVHSAVNTGIDSHNRFFKGFCVIKANLVLKAKQGQLFACEYRLYKFLNGAGSEKKKAGPVVPDPALRSEVRTNCGEGRQSSHGLFSGASQLHIAVASAATIGGADTEAFLYSEERFL